jgi:WD40 repeat protein
VVYGRGKWISKNETIDPNRTLVGNETSDGLDRSSLGMKNSMGKDSSIKDRRVLCVGYDNGDVVIVNLVNKEKFMYSVGSPIKTMHYCEGNKILFVLSQNSNLTLIDIAKESIFSKELFRMVGSIYCTRTSYDNESIYVGGASGVLKKISIKDCALVEDLGQIHTGAIFSFCISANGEWLFTSDSKGEIKQFSLNKDSYHEHIGDCVDIGDCKDIYDDKEKKKAHISDIRAMECTGDSEFIFSADKNGFLKQWSTEDLSLLENYGKVTSNMIYTLSITADSEWLFLADETGLLLQFDIKSRILEKDYGRIHSGEIYSIACSPDNQHLFTSDNKGNVKQWAIREQTLVYNFGDVHDGICYSICCSPDGNYIFTSDSRGEIKQFSVMQQKILKNFGFVHSYPIYSMTCTDDSKLLITSDIRGNVKQFSIKEKGLFLPFEKFSDKEISA